jgi:uncharacterized protein YdhG (YjbR/CyaY superfamily)
MSAQTAPKKPVDRKTPVGARRTGRVHAPASAVVRTAPTAEDVTAYIAGCEPAVRPVLRRIRAIIRAEVPEATETISYRMPAFFLHGAFIYYAPFRAHIGLFPPVKGDAALNKALAPHRGPKGNLRFSLGQPMPYSLIRRVVRARLTEHRARLASKRRRT